MLPEDEVRLIDISIVAQFCGLIMSLV